MDIQRVQSLGFLLGLVGRVRDDAAVPCVVSEPLLHGLIGVVLAQLVHAEELAAAVGADAEILPSPLQGIAEGLKGTDKLRVGEAMLDGRIHIPADLSAHGLPSLLLGLDLPDVAGLPSLRVLDNRQAVLSAEAVGCFAHLAVGVLAIVIPLLIKARGRKRVMIVDMASVTMSGNHNGEVISPQLVSQLDSDLMGGLGIHLTRLEALIGMIGNRQGLALALTVERTDDRRRILNGTVNGSDVPALLGFQIVDAVSDQRLQRVLIILLHGLFHVGNVGNQLTQMTFNSPYLGRCQT